MRALRAPFLRKDEVDPVILKHRELRRRTKKIFAADSGHWCPRHHAAAEQTEGAAMGGFRIVNERAGSIEGRPMSDDDYSLRLDSSQSGKPPAEHGGMVQAKEPRLDQFRAGRNQSDLVASYTTAKPLNERPLAFGDVRIELEQGCLLPRFRQSANLVFYRGRDSTAEPPISAEHDVENHRATREMVRSQLGNADMSLASASQ
jgi:hypothetical protein